MRVCECLVSHEEGRQVQALIAATVSAASEEILSDVLLQYTQREHTSAVRWTLLVFFIPIQVHFVVNMHLFIV